MAQRGAGNGSSRVPDHGEHAAPVDAGASVLVDVGPGRGALVIRLDESFRGRELEISVRGAHHRVHTGVHERGTRGHHGLFAVFGSLPAGDYTLWRDAEAALGTVRVTGGRVVEARLRDDGLEAAPLA